MKDKVYSFDIFDTLVIRKVAEPIAVFLLVQEKIKDFPLSDFIKNNFAKIRQEAEYYCQERELVLNNKYDCSLDELYRVIQNNYLLSDEIIENIKNIEVQEEINNILPVTKNVENVKKLISKGEKVILISDMYIGADILRRILTNIDGIFADIEIYSSADTGKRKSNGSQYRLIQEKYEIVEHCGDNEFSDITQAKWNGIKAVKFNPVQLKPYEKQLLNKYPDNIFIQKSIGISRSIRQNSDNNKLFNFAVSFAAPILFGYVDWVLKESLNRSIKNLYFVARDGFVPKIIADIIIQKRNYDIKTHYFYSSRRASRIADESNIKKYINQIFSELKNMQTEEFIARRFEITINELKSFGGLDKEKLINNNEFKQLIINKNKPKKELFLKYIKQEVDFNEKFGFVDLNGSGRTQDNLAELINKEMGECIITSFYFNLQTDMELQNNSIKSAYINSINLNSLILELLCRTLHGQTLGYHEEDGKIKPILEYENNQNMEKWGFNIYLDGIKAYTEFMTQENMNDIKLAMYYLKYARENTDKETADVIGSIPFGIYGDEKKVKEYIPSYNLFNLFTKNDFPNIASSRANFVVKYLALFINKITDKKTYGYISKKRDLAYLKLFGKKINIRSFLWK